MANIKVNHKQLEKSADEINSYIASHKSNMRKIDSEMTGLGSKWEGSDYQQVLVEWQKIKGEGSVSQELLKALEEYEDYLRFAANKYKKAQVDAVNRASLLPHHI